MSEHIRMAAQASKKHFSIWVAQGTPDKLKIKKKKTAEGPHLRPIKLTPPYPCSGYPGTSICYKPCDYTMQPRLRTKFSYLDLLKKYAKR
jgi:hypothetical protein